MHDHKVVIGVIYKPPESNTDTFVAHFSDVLGIISKERKQCILMGDFNLDLIKVDNSNQTKDFVHSLYTNAFYPTISKPTRVTEHSGTLLDNIITNITGYCIKSGVLYNDISSRSISAGLPISYCLHVKVGSASGRQVSPVIPEVSRRCDVTPEVETVTYRVYRVLSQQVCVC